MTIPLPLSLRQNIFSTAKSFYPEEVCGVILAEDALLFFKNESNNPTENFLLPSVVYELDGVTHIFHSHCNGNHRFSQQDIATAKEIGEWDWYLVSLDPQMNTLDDAAEDYLDVRNRSNLPYLEREWRWCWTDCYALCRDFYFREFQIQLDDFERGEEGEWMEPDFTKFEDNMEGQGFVRIEPDGLKKGDFLLMQLAGAPRANHIAVMLDSSTFMHHLAYNLSSREVWGGYWERGTVSCWRHKDVN